MPLVLNKTKLETIIMEELEQTLLAEGRLDDVKKKYPELAERGAIDELSKGDPSGNNAYLGWMAKQLGIFYSLTQGVDDKSEQLDMRARHPEQIANVVKQFHQNKQRLEKKDIYQYYSIGDLQDAVNELGKTRSQKRKFEKEEAMEGSEIIYEDENFFAIRPFTQQASCHYGANSKWCISARGNNYFDQYTSDGKGFVFLRMNHLAGQSENGEREYALVYDRDGELETTFDINDVETDVDTFKDTVAVNILEGIFDGTKYAGKGQEIYADIYSASNTADDGDKVPGIYKAIAKALYEQYEETGQLDDLPDLSDVELYELAEWLTIALIQPGYTIESLGGTSIMDNPPGPSIEALDEVVSNFQNEAQHSHVDYYADEGVTFNGGMSLVFDDFPLDEWSEKVQDEYDTYGSDSEDKIKEIASDALSDSNIYPDEMEISWEGRWDRERGAYANDNKVLHIRMDFYPEYENASVAGFQEYADRLLAYDGEADEAKKVFIDKCMKAMLIRSDAYTSIEQIKNDALQDLAHFDEAEVGDGEVTFYGDLIVQIPRMPQFIVDVSKKVGTVKNPGPMRWFGERVTGPYRNEDETLVKFYLAKVLKELSRNTQLDQEWRMQLGKMFNKIYDKEAALSKAQGKLDLQEEADYEDNLFQSADFSFNVVKAQRIYHPESGKMTIPFYVEIPMRDNTIKRSLKFIKDVDRLWDSVETVYETALSKYLKGWYENQETVLRNAVEEAKPPTEEPEEETALQEGRKQPQVPIYFKKWRTFKSKQGITQ